MKVVKIQTRDHDKMLTILYEMYEVIQNAEYVKCTADGKGLHFLPLEV